MRFDGLEAREVSYEDAVAVARLVRGRVRVGVGVGVRVIVGLRVRGVDKVAYISPISP